MLNTDGKTITGNFALPDREKYDALDELKFLFAAQSIFRFDTTSDEAGVLLAERWVPFIVEKISETQFDWKKDGKVFASITL